MGAMRTVIAALGILTLSSACSRKLSYADDVDTNALKAAFQCSGPTSGERARACRIIDDFASAGPFESAPAKGHEAWAGQMVCADAVDVPDGIAFAGVYLKPGVGEKLWPDDVKTDPSRDLPFGGHFGNSYVSKITPVSLKSEYLKANEAAEKGTSPDFSKLSDFERATMDRFWENLKKPPDMANRKYQRLVRSNGKSVLGNPFTSDTKMRPSATYFVRSKPPRMLVVYPASKEPGAAAKSTDCVAELSKIFVEP
jgi:hypothetical protein